MRIVWHLQAPSLVLITAKASESKQAQKHTHTHPQPRAVCGGKCLMTHTCSSTIAWQVLQAPLGGTCALTSLQTAQSYLRTGEKKSIGETVQVPLVSPESHGRKESFKTSPARLISAKHPLEGGTFSAKCWQTKPYLWCSRGNALRLY